MSSDWLIFIFGAVAQPRGKWPNLGPTLSYLKMADFSCLSYLSYLLF
jgi:hypothetical protein